MQDGVIRSAVIGLGRAGWINHFLPMSRREDTKVVAVADPLPERREEAKASVGCRTYSTLGRLLKQQDDLDLIAVATPSHLHGRDTKKCLKSGHHVVVEKPMAMTLPEADSMIRAAKLAGRKLFVFQNQRFQPFCSHLNEIIRSGILGRVYHIRCQRAEFARRNDWQTLSKFGGGLLNNKCTHELDMIMEFMGTPVVNVMGDLQQIASPGDVEDHAKIFLKGANGCTADLEISSAQNIAGGVPKWVVCGSCGTLTSDGKTSTIRHFDPQAAPALAVDEGAAKNRAYGNDDVLPWQERVVPATGRDRGSIYDNITGVLLRGESMRVTPESVRERVRVIAAVRKGTNFVKPVKR